jgi:hypothetical protein
VQHEDDIKMFAPFLAYIPLKMKGRLIRSPVCLPMCPPVLLNHLVDFHEIQQGGHIIEGDLDVIFFIP